MPDRRRRPTAGGSPCSAPSVAHARRVAGQRQRGRRRPGSHAAATSRRRSARSRGRTTRSARRRSRSPRPASCATKLCTMNTVPIGRITKPHDVEAAGRRGRDRAGAEVLDLDRVGERDHRLARAREHHREREHEERAERGARHGTRDHDMIGAVAKAEKTILELEGHEVIVSNPSKVYFPRAGITKLELVDYYLAVADGALRGVARRPMILKRFVNGADGEPFYQKRVARRTGRRGSRPRRSRFRRGAPPTRSWSNDAARLAWRGQPRLHRSQPARGARRRHGAPRRAAHRSRSGAGRGVAADPRGRRGRARGARRVRARRLAEDVSGSRGAHVWVRIARALGVRERAACGAGVRARGRAARAGDRDGEVVEGGAPRRVPRLQPERARSHDVQRVLGARRRRMRACRCRCAWDEFLRCDPADYTLRDRARAVRGARRRARRRSTRTPGASTGCSTLADAGPRRMRRGRRTSRRRPARRRAWRRRAARARAAEAPGDHHRAGEAEADALAGLERWKARHPEVAARLAPEDVLVDANRGRSTAWYRVRINLEHVPAGEHPPARAAGPDYDPRVEWLGEG